MIIDMKLTKIFLAVFAGLFFFSLDASAQSVTIYMNSGATVTFEDNSHSAVVLNDDGVAPVMASAVDLGLPSGTLWADMNVGAMKPEDFGGLYAWGEAEIKTDYGWNTYSLCEGDYQSMIKYCKDDTYGKADGKTVLDPEDDTATILMGDDWEMPTYEQMYELRNNCKWEWTNQNGVKGYKVTGPNGNSIFLPATGYYYHDEYLASNSQAFYWTRTLSDKEDSYSARHLYIDFEAYNMAYGSRFQGQAVRAVKK